MARPAQLRPAKHLVSTVRLVRRRPRFAPTIPVERFEAWAADQRAEVATTIIPEAPATVPVLCGPVSFPPTKPPPSPCGSVIPRRIMKDAAVLTSDMTPRQMFVLHLVDGATPLDDIIAASGLEERDAIASVADLVARGMVQLFE
jgi:hypothetical protein